MKNYIRYQIQNRKYSSNALEGVYLHKNDKGEYIEKAEILFLCGLPKKQGDIFIEQLLSDFTHNLNNQD